MMQTLQYRISITSILKSQTINAAKQFNTFILNTLFTKITEMTVSHCEKITDYCLLFITATTYLQDLLGCQYFKQTGRERRDTRGVQVLYLSYQKSGNFHMNQ